jgi:uncharacterized membrane protein
MVLGVNLMTAFWLFWQQARGDANAKIILIATPITLAFLNAVVLWSIRAKNRRLQLTTPASLVVAAIILAVVASGCFWVALHRDLDFSNEILDEAVSSKPISAIKPESRAILVQLLRTRLQNSREHNADASRFKPVTPALYSAESFENKHVIQSVKSQVEAAASLDIRYAGKQQEAMDEFRARMSKADPAYLASFEAQRRGADDEFAKALLQEKQWLDATSALYDFAAANQKMMKLKGNQLVFSDPRVKATFEDDKEHSVDLLNKVQAMEKQQAERKEKAMPDVPLSKLGLRGN